MRNSKFFDHFLNQAAEKENGDKFMRVFTSKSFRLFIVL